VRGCVCVCVCVHACLHVRVLAREVMSHDCKSFVTRV